MALNTAHADGGVLIYNGERILIFYDGIEMSFDMEAPMPHFKGNKKGRIYLTTHRGNLQRETPNKSPYDERPPHLKDCILVTFKMIFNNKDKKDTLQSFSMPFTSLRNVELEQPVFGANYIKGSVRAESGGNWNGQGKFKMWFKDGGCIEFGKCLLEAGKRATRNAPRAPPPYTPPSGPYYQAPPPAYAPPAGPQYGFIPYGAFPTAPPADGVYMTDAPPPYPGIDPNLPPYTPMGAAAAYPPGAGYPPPADGYPPPSAAYPPGPGGYPPASSYPPPGAGGYPPQENGFQQNPAHAAKAAEAAASAYYNPANPHNVYMPQQYDPPGYPSDAPPAYSAPPPSYHDINKKSQ